VFWLAVGRHWPSSLDMTYIGVPSPSSVIAGLVDRSAE
jgi:hypothetical protein